MRKFLLALKLAAAGLVLAVVTTAATALVALLSGSDCLRGAVTHGILPSPAFRISVDRRVLEFDGPIAYGVGATLERLVETHGTIKVLHLASSGGRLAEARRMAALVKDRNLDTYVSAGCDSACAYVFLAGHERLIGPSGRLGFHQGGFAGPGKPTEDEQKAFDGAQIAELRSFGVSEAFARKATATPNHTLWHPSQHELLAERIVTRIVDPSELSASPRVCTHAPSRADVLARLGGLIFDMGGTGAAIRYLDWALQSQPDHGGALMHRATAFFHSYRFDRSMADLVRVIELDPRSFQAFRLRGRIHLRKGENDRAIRDFDEVLRLALRHLDPDEEATVLALRAHAHQGLGAYERTIADYARAIDLAPKDARFYNGRAWAYFKFGKAAEGLPDAERALQLRPDFANAIDTRGHILEALGRREEAIADFRRTLAIDPSIQLSKDALKRLGATTEGAG